MGSKVAHAAPAPGISRQPDLQDAFVRLLEADNGRAYGCTYEGAYTVVSIVDREAKDVVTVRLPTFIRGQFVADLREFLDVELAVPIQPEDLEKISP
jgi:hypothetical protein